VQSVFLFTLFAGLTVIIALAALVVPGLPFLAVMGVAAAATVAVAVVVAIVFPSAVGVNWSCKRSSRSDSKRPFDCRTS
jgi:uncharacterized membrane protein YdfJ with MMPL/SSD domain